MSALHRLLPASRRSYSSFSSSKSGGGRFFNSAKPPKSSVIATATRQPSKSPPNAAVNASDGSDSREGGINAKDCQAVESTPGSVDAPSTQPGAVGSSTPTMTNPGETDNASAPQGDSRASNTHPPNAPTTTPWFLHSPHLAVKAKDFKLHQFFSMHRPLLLLSNPPSIFHTSVPSDFLPPAQPSPSEEPIFTSDTHDLPALPANVLSSVYNSPSTVTVFDQLPETSPEGDSETARQLTRAIAMNKAGAMAEWEATLRRLGLDVEMEPQRVEMKEQMEKEWEVMMDSTKRKRRKKMRKHKLKKRRRVTRASRLKIGR
ncbi:hypothetical protein APHAL10511_000982 [Amanita phalloides]|nr:hypothetical protein APHAL10511_000982 [Amanita phalloides]